MNNHPLWLRRFFLSISLFVCSIAAQTDAGRLDLSKMVERDLKIGQSHQYEVLLTAEQVQPAFQVKSKSSDLPAISGDEAELRELTIKFWRSLAARDVETHLSVWSKTSKEGSSNWKNIPQRWEILDNLELRKLDIHKVMMAADEAKVRLTVNLAATHKRTGAPMGGYMNRDANLTFIYKRDSGKWLLDSWVGTAMEVADSMIPLSSDSERDAFLAAENLAVDRDLVNELSVRGYSLGMRDHDWESANGLLNYSLRKAQALKDPEMIGQVVNMIASIQNRLGDHASALNSSLLYLLTAEQTSDGNVANAYNSVGVSYAILEDFDRAIDAYRKSLNVTTARPRSPQSRARVIGNIAMSQLQNGDFAGAKATYEELLRLAKESKLENEFPRAYSGLARVYQNAGDLQKALSFDAEAVKSVEGTKDRGATQGIFKSAAEGYLAAGNYEEARKLAMEAFRVAMEMRTPALGWDAKVTEGKALTNLGRLDEAADAFKVAISIIEAMRDRSLGSIDSQQRFFENKQSPYRAMLNLLLLQGKKDEAFVFTERAKARVLVSLLSGGRMDIGRSLSTDERQNERKLTAKLATLNTSLQSEGFRPNPDPNRIARAEREVEEARRELETFRIRLFAQHPELRLFRGEAEPLTAAEASGMVSDRRTLLLHYTQTDDKIVFFAFANDFTYSRERVLSSRLDISAARLTELVGSFRTKLGSGKVPGQRSFLSATPSLSSSRSQVSPRPSPSKSSCSGLWVSGQLSSESMTPSLSSSSSHSSPMPS